jgi:hypothetical protein
MQQNAVSKMGIRRYGFLETSRINVSKMWKGELGVLYTNSPPYMDEKEKQVVPLWHFHRPKYNIKGDDEVLRRI